MSRKVDTKQNAGYLSRKFKYKKNPQPGQQKYKYLRENTEICDSVERGLSRVYISLS